MNFKDCYMSLMTYRKPPEVETMRRAEMQLATTIDDLKEKETTLRGDLATLAKDVKRAQAANAGNKVKQLVTSSAAKRDTRVENETGGDSESRSNSTACCIGIKAARLSLKPSDSSFCSFMICQGSRLLCRIGDESCDWESSPGVSEKSVASIQKTSALRRDSFSRLPAMLCAHASFVSMV